MVQNEHPNRGQGLSIAIGVRHLVENSPIPLDGILCSVGDQPLLIRDDVGYDIDTPDDFERLKQRESEAL